MIACVWSPTSDVCTFKSPGHARAFLAMETESPAQRVTLIAVEPAGSVSGAETVMRPLTSLLMR